jgi:DNA-binding MarR family transcriptional regulator
MDIVEVRVLQTQLKSLQRRQRREWTPVAGLSQPSLRVLGAIARHDGVCQPSDIAEELRMTTSNVAAALRALEARDFVVRRRSTADTRRVDVSLTVAGRQLVADTRTERDGWLQTAIEATLDDAEQALLLAAGQLIERVSGFHDRVSPRADS